LSFLERRGLKTDDISSPTQAAADKMKKSGAQITFYHMACHDRSRRQPLEGYQTGETRRNKMSIDLKQENL
jgi:hypothetical protein